MSVATEKIPPATDEQWLLPVFTLVLWLGCATVALLGFVLPYAHPHSPKPPQISQATILNVELDNSPAIDQQPVAKTPAPTPSRDEMIQPPVAQPIPVAQYSPAIAFALPVEGPTRIVDARNAADSRPSANVVSPQPQMLTYGQGEGRQPEPEYPRQSVREGQEGAVIIRLTVGENGRVTAAEVASPSPWPLLNESALRTVRERWRFSTGAVRVYEVSIRFELTK